MMKRRDIYLIIMVFLLGACGGDSYDDWSSDKVSFEHSYKDGTGNLRKTNIILSRRLVEETDISQWGFSGKADLAIIEAKYEFRHPRTFYVNRDRGVELYLSNSCIEKSPCIKTKVYGIGQNAYGVEGSHIIRHGLQFSFPEGNYVSRPFTF